MDKTVTVTISTDQGLVLAAFVVEVPEGSTPAAVSNEIEDRVGRHFNVEED